MQLDRQVSHPLFHFHRTVEESYPSIMFLRTIWLLTLTANASAFVVRPASLGRCSVAVSPICSSLSDPDTEINQEAEAGVESPVEVDSIELVESIDSSEAAEASEGVEAVESTDSVEATEASEDGSSTQINTGPPVRYTVYIGNLPFSKNCFYDPVLCLSLQLTIFLSRRILATSVQELRDMCSEHVEVRFVNLPRDRESERIRGFAFVDVGSEEEIVKLVDALAGKELGGRPLRVSRSLDKDQIRSTKKTCRFPIDLVWLCCFLSHFLSRADTIDEGATKLYVGNISFESTKDDIQEYFGQYGEVNDVFIPVNKFGDSRGFCFITVKEEDAEAVIEATNGAEFMGRPITVNHPLPPGEKPKKREQPGRMKIFVGNLSFYTTDGTLTEVFSEFGEVYDCYIPRDIESNNSRGFGFITMARDAGGEAIDALNGCELDGRDISVNEARPRGPGTRESDAEDTNDASNQDDGDFIP
eukprot:scaffold1319_cov126-Cylindrotheca_fusiformis.AAC.31